MLTTFSSVERVSEEPEMTSGFFVVLERVQKLQTPFAFASGLIWTPRALKPVLQPFEGCDRCDSKDYVAQNIGNDLFGFLLPDWRH